MLARELSKEKDPNEYLSPQGTRISLVKSLLESRFQD